MAQIRKSAFGLAFLVLSACRGAASGADGSNGSTLRGETEVTHATVELPASESDRMPVDGEASTVDSIGLHPYQRGRWRLGARGRLANVVLFLSHILVRHKESRDDRVAFSLVDWRSPQAPSGRTRQQAFRLATELAQRARAAPAQFESLARQFSEDPTTRQNGGDLGGVRALNLLRWPEILDAVAATPSGSITRVVETTAGYHVLHHQPSPASTLLTARRIVVGHADAPWLIHQGRHGAPTRLRAEALALAKDLQRRAVGNPSDFPALVKRFSDHDDASREGDIGTWSLREAAPFPRVLAAVRRLAVGEVSEPVDTLFGYQVLLRGANLPRDSYVVGEIRVPFVRGGSEYKNKALAQSRDWLAEVRETPEAFDRLRAQHCCRGLRRVIEGRGPVASTKALSRLKVGEFVTQPVQNRSYFSIFRLEKSSQLPVARPIEFELPSPPTPDVAYVISHMSNLGRELLGQRVVAQLYARALPVPMVNQLAELQAPVLAREGWMSNDPTPALSSLYSGADAIMSVSRTGMYRKLLVAALEELVLGENRP